MRTRDKRTGSSNTKTVLPIWNKQYWDHQLFEGKVHTGKGWVSLSIRCYRNYLHIGLDELISKVASKSRFLRLHTTRSAQE